MLKEPILLIMAAGMGSRYGGLKQIDPVGSAGELIIDFSLYDAMRAGFKKVIFIVKKENESDFRALIDGGAGKFLETEYAFQTLSDIPKEFSVPEGRVKPWGTCHAVLSAKHLIDSPFAVINADDFYGSDAFQKSYDFLALSEDDAKLSCCMIGYKLENTLTEHGHVARGICDVSGGGFLTGIVERTRVMRSGGQIAFSEDEGNTWVEIKENSLVSMNFWGFSKKILSNFEEKFSIFLANAIKNDPLKSEFYLPAAVGQLINEGRADFKVLMSNDRWHGVTYKDDKAAVVAAIQAMKNTGIYPGILWK